MTVEPQQPTARNLVTLAEAARRIGRNKRTVQNWIYNGTLRAGQGLCRVNGRPAIDWPLFEAAFIHRGEA